MRMMVHLFSFYELRFVGFCVALRKMMLCHVMIGFDRTGGDDWLGLDVDRIIQMMMIFHRCAGFLTSNLSLISVQ